MKVAANAVSRTNGAPRPKTTKKKPALVLVPPPAAVPPPLVNGVRGAHLRALRYAMKVIDRYPWPSCTTEIAAAVSDTIIREMCNTPGASDLTIDFWHKRICDEFIARGVEAQPTIVDAMTDALATLEKVSAKLDWTKYILDLPVDATPDERLKAVFAELRSSRAYVQKLMSRLRRARLVAA